MDLRVGRAELEASRHVTLPSAETALRLRERRITIPRPQLRGTGARRWGVDWFQSPTARHCASFEGEGGGRNGKRTLGLPIPATGSQRRPCPPPKVEFVSNHGEPRSRVS